MKQHDLKMFLFIYLLDLEYCKKNYSVGFISLGIKPKIKFNYFSTVEKILRRERDFAERCIYKLYSFLLAYETVRNTHENVV